MIATFFDMPQLTSVLRVTTIVYLLGGLIVVAESLLRRELRFKLVSVIQLSTYAAFGIVSVVAAALNAGVWALVAGYMARSVVEALLVLECQPHSKRLRLDRTALRDLLSFGGGTTASQIANYCALQGDNFVVGRLLGASSLGIYGRSYSLMAMPANLVGSTADTVLFPAMAKVQDDPERLATAFCRSMAMTALIGLPVSALTFVLAPEIVSVVLGDQWNNVTSVLRILSLGVFFRMGYKFGGSVARARGRVFQIAWRQCVYAAAVVGGAWLGAWLLDLRGVAYAVLVALVLIFVLLMDLALRVTRVSCGALVRLHVPPLLLACVIFMVAEFTAWALRQLGAPDLVTLIVVSGASLLVATGAARLLPAVFLGDEGVSGVQTMGKFFAERCLGD